MLMLLIFSIGLLVGSFLNVLADRLPKEESVVKGRSHCEKCKKELVWFDLIPLLSFILLKGKCRYCKAKLSFYYPIVELTTGILFVLVYLFLIKESIMYQVLSIEYVWELFYYLFITSCLIVIFFADLKYGIIPDKIIVPAIFATTAYLFLISHLSFLNYFLSAVGACLFFLLLSLIKIKKRRGMGFGDVKFAFLMGLILGFPNIVISLYIAFLTGAIVGIILILWRRKKAFGTTIPFGPFLVMGSLAAIFFGNFLVQNFLRVLR